MSEKRILRLRGLPWTVGEAEVRQFLQLDSVHEVFIRKRGELSTGEAYVELSSPEEATDVQDSYNRKMLGGRYIEIFFAEATSMADLKEVIREQDKGWVVRLRGLPFKATQEDVLDFFGGIEVTNGLSGITLIYGRDGRPMGEAYVELPDEESQTKALHLDRERMGARYIEVFKSTKADLSVRLQSARKNEGLRRQTWDSSAALSLEQQVGIPAGGPGMLMVPYATVPPQSLAPGPSSPSLRLLGLPGDSTEADVAHFFGDSGIMPTSVQISSEGRGPFPVSKVAYVSFASPAVADAARQQSQHRLFKEQPIQVYPAPALPTGQQALPGFQQPAMPMSGMWAYSPMGYMYDDLSKLIRPKSAGLPFQPPSPVARPGMPVHSPMGYMASPGLVPGQGPFGGPLMHQSSGSPSFGSRQAPSSPGRLPPMGQARSFSPRHLPLQQVMRPASPVSMSQQQQMLLQQNQLFLLQQQQQQQFLLHQQAARLPPVPWNLSAQHALGPGQYAPQLRPNPAYTARNLPQRLDDVTLAQAGAQPATAALIGDQIDAVQRTAGPLQQSNPISVGQPTTSVLSLQNSQDNLSAFAGRQASSRSSHPDLSASLGQQGRSLLPGHDSSFVPASSSNLSERHSDPVVQNLSIASLHLSDRAPSGRSHATSTTASAPSDGLRTHSTTIRGSSQNLPDGSH